MDHCGCRYEPLIVRGKYVGGNLIYCPRHAAADAMYEAAPELISACGTCGGVGIISAVATWNEASRGYNSSEIPCPSCDRMRAAIALADGAD